MVARIGLMIATLFVALAVQASPDIEYWKTTNGARVYFVSAPELPMVDITVVFDAGSARDNELSGTALLTNAMLNEGAGGLSANQLAAAFDDVGAQFSNSSERDMALLSLRTLTDETILESALQAFSKVLNKPDFPQVGFDRLKKQMLIGLQAEKQSPSAIASRAFYKNVYKEHPYSNMPAGDEDGVAKLTIESLKMFYQQYYVAANAVVVLVGDIGQSQAKIIAEQLVSTLPVGKQAVDLPVVQSLTGAIVEEIEYPSSQTHIAMGQPGMNRGDADYFALYVGNHILGGSGLVSQLSNEVREKRGLSYSVYSYFRPMRELGPYQFGLQTRNDQAEEALNVMQQTLKDFIKNGPTEAELVAAKQNITGGFALRVDSNSKIAGYLTMIGFYDLPIDYLESFKDKVDAITVKQIKDAFSRRVKPENMVTVLVGGKAE
ncbi:MAG: insulinase family protein [Piscirickettsiaceae bacterium]|nr:insulinase family protein [Piscirickettsiaceae bacterium]